MSTSFAGHAGSKTAPIAKNLSSVASVCDASCRKTETAQGKTAVEFVPIEVIELVFCAIEQLRFRQEILDPIQGKTSTAASLRRAHYEAFEAVVAVSMIAPQQDQLFKGEGSSASHASLYNIGFILCNFKSSFHGFYDDSD